MMLHEVVFPCYSFECSEKLQKQCLASYSYLFPSITVASYRRSITFD